MKIQNILILAGGDSTRFWPMSDKNTFSFLGQPLIFHIIEAVKEYSEHIFVVTNPTNNELVKQRSSVKVQTVVVPDPTQSNMGKAVLLCKDLIKGEVLVLNAVDIFDFKVLGEMTKKLGKKNDFMFVAKELKEYFPGAYVQFEGKAVKNFVEKPDPDKIPSNFTKLVSDYFSDFSKFIEILEKTTTDKDDLYEQAINTYIKAHPKVDYVTYNDYWFTLKFPWHVLSMMRYFLQTIKKEMVGKGTKISKNALVVGPVWIGNNVKIGDFTKIVGPTYIGDNTVIGDHTLVRESHVGNSALVGGGSEVARSYIGEKVMLHRNYVGDSVLDKRVLFGSGVVTANFRFDEKTIYSKVGEKKIDTRLQKCGAFIGKGAKIGVNSTIFPGVKIGVNTFVIPGETVPEDIDDNQFLMRGTLKKNIL
jgi:bifunctional UDP-N-acetylglucosamine pyrophosphorylase/glucosamine-1-phosphate N-acetyltransferase